MWTPEGKARGMYAILLFVSLPIPLLHHAALGDALRAVRCSSGLHPFQNLIVWHLGSLGTILPIMLLCLLALSWRLKWLCAPTTVVRVDLAVSIFTMTYAMRSAAPWRSG